MRRMLVVDDEPEVEVLFRQCFRREIRQGEFGVSFVVTADDALQVLDPAGAAHAPGIALVFADINMPGMNGFELLARIREQDTSLPVYLVTAYDSADYQERAHVLGATGYIIKPVPLAEIRRVALSS